MRVLVIGLIVLALSVAGISTLKWSGFLGQVCGLAKMHRVCVHAAFRVSACWKYTLSGVLLSRAVWGRSEL